MLRLLGLPAPFMAVIILVVMAYLIYRMVAMGTVQPLVVVVLLVLAFALVRIIWQMLRKPQVSGNEDD